MDYKAGIGLDTQESKGIPSELYLNDLTHAHKLSCQKWKGKAFCYNALQVSCLSTYTEFHMYAPEYWEDFVHNNKIDCLTSDNLQESIR